MMVRAFQAIALVVLLSALNFHCACGRSVGVDTLGVENKCGDGAPGGR